MKVLHIFHEIKFSGAEIMYANAAPSMQKEGLQLLAISTGKNLGDFATQFEKVNIKMYHKQIDFKFFSIKSYNYYKEFYRFLINEKIEVLHIHRIDIYFAALIARFAGVKCIKTQHNVFQNRWFTLPYQILIRSVERKVFKTKFHSIGESVYLNELDYYKNPSLRINNWFDTNKFYPISSKAEKINIRKELNIDEDAFVIISTGSCSKVKNHSDIIRALSLVKDKIKCVYLHLGHGVTQGEEKELSEQLGVSELISFLGNKTNVRDYLIASDLFVMSSQFEGMSIAAIEAMGCKLPSVFYNVPGLKDLIKNNNNGFLIDSDFKILAEKIIYLHQNPQVAKEMADNAFHFVNEEFSMHTNVPKIIDFYKAD